MEFNFFLKFWNHQNGVPAYIFIRKNISFIENEAKPYNEKNDRSIAYKDTTTHCPHRVQGDQGIHAVSNFNSCTIGVTLHLDDTSNHTRIPLKSSQVIVAKLITRTNEQL
jgi:hypothetical protein